MKAIKTVVYSSHFSRAAQKLPSELQKEVREREALFRRDCFYPRLRTHKLKGKQHDLWSFSITYSHRIVFRFLAEDTVYFIEVGDHSIYQ